MYEAYKKMCKFVTCIVNFSWCLYFIRTNIAG